MSSWAEKCAKHDAFVSRLKADSLQSLVEDLAGKLEELSNKVVELEELVAKTRRRRCGCCNLEACEYE